MERRCPECDNRVTLGLTSGGLAYCLECGWEGNRPKPKKHDHRSSLWIIAGGGILWCYQCGAWTYNGKYREQAQPVEQADRHRRT